MISVILPTYNEALNIQRIVCALSKVFQDEEIPGEVIVVDDNSPDGTARIAADLSPSCPVKVHVRTGDRGLSRSVIEGFSLAQGDICVVMDADLSHPVEKIPDMIKPILDGNCDVTVGSRYIEGGGGQNWPLIRRLISRGAGLLARGITTLSDPTSGFMAVKKTALEGVTLDPLGWKIVLEVAVKTKARVREVPIVFGNRERGDSKFGLKAEGDYLRQLGRLYADRYPLFFGPAKSFLVGLSALLIDTAVLVFFVGIVSWDPRIAAVLAYPAALAWICLLSPKGARASRRSISAVASCRPFVPIFIGGLAVRVGVMHVLIAYAGLGAGPWYILASFVGIVAATLFGLLGIRYVAPKK